MKIAFCGGGTGGHVYPALAVAAAMRKLDLSEAVELLYIGVRGKMDGDIVAARGHPVQSRHGRAAAGRHVLAHREGRPELVVRHGPGLHVLRQFKPDVVFATGGYGSVGVGMAARARKVPLLLFLPDVEAGMAVSTLARVADRIAVTVPPAQEKLGYEKTVLTGYPVRESFFGVDKMEARKQLSLDPGAAGTARLGRQQRRREAQPRRLVLGRRLPSGRARCFTSAAAPTRRGCEPAWRCCTRSDGAATTCTPTCTTRCRWRLRPPTSASCAPAPPPWASCRPTRLPAILSPASTRVGPGA